MALFCHFVFGARLEALELVEGAVIGGHDNLLEEEGLEGADGLQFVLEGLAGFVEFVHILAVDAG